MDKTIRCPECKCAATRDVDLLGEGYHRCANCSQEWWTDVDYTVPAKKQSIVVFDLEGTLSDHNHRKQFWVEQDYKQYNDRFKDDPLNEFAADLLRGHRRDGNLIYIVTAKSQEDKIQVREWLERHKIYCFIDSVIFRPPGDTRRSVIVKQEIFSKLINEHHIVISYDDRPENIKMMQNLGILATDINQLTSDKTPQTPADVLSQAAVTFAKKNEEYGSAYLRHGRIMAEFFPDGITLKTPEDFFKFHLFELDVIKSNRLASAQLNHKDSWHDKMVYAAMGELSIKE